MAPRYEIGQQVIIKPVNSQTFSPRDCNIEPYAGQVGEIADYYWMSPPAGGVFCIYTIRVGTEYKEIVLHEDEIEALAT